MSLLQPAAIVDVDGTLVNVTGVRHYVLGDRNHKDFDHFHLGAAYCPPVPGVIEAVQELHERGYRIVIVTARKRQWEYLTRIWLRKWGVPYDELHMRGNSDARKDVLVKSDILAMLREKYDIRVAYDDNPSVIALWESEGIPVVKIPGWIESLDQDYSDPEPYVTFRPRSTDLPLENR
jgi:hypothetical protein